MMIPDIFQIIKVSLTIGKKIIFYLPRTTMLSEFFGILDQIISPRTEKYLFADIHILNSANKIKAVMLVFGTKLEENVNLKYFTNFSYQL